MNNTSFGYFETDFDIIFYLLERGLCDINLDTLQKDIQLDIQLDKILIVDRPHFHNRYISAIFDPFTTVNVICTPREFISNVYQNIILGIGNYNDDSKIILKKITHVHNGV